MKKILLILVVFISAIEASGYNVKDISECSKGNSLSCNRIGNLYESGTIVKQNLTKAKRYYQKSCQLKLGKGCRDLAQVLIKEENYNKALEYYSEGCNLNNSDACSDLAFLFEKGKSVTLDYSQAKKHYKKACELGNETSCKNYAYLDKNGIS